MATVFRLVVMDNRNERMQHLRTHIAGIVINRLNIQTLLHIVGKDTKTLRHNKALA